MASSGAVVCTRCRKEGHAAKDCCNLPFLRKSTWAEERAQARAEWEAREATREKKRAEWEARQAENETKRAEWEARQAEWKQKRAEWEDREAKREKKRAEWEARQAEWKQRRAEREAGQAQRKAQHPDWETCSQTTDASTAVTATALSPEDMLERRKTVRRHEKTLREIVKLAGRSDLDALQRAKLERRPEVEAELRLAKGLARTRA